jgi:FKBP-type peptidyl-prolyl cis-trans isomerase
MNKLTFALLLLVASCNSTPDTYKTPSGVTFRVIHTKKDGLGAPTISTVKVVPTLKKDSNHSQLPVYKMVIPPAPYMSDPLAEVLMTGVHEGDSLIVTDKEDHEMTYKIEKVYIPGYQGLNADSLIEVDKHKEIAIMQKEQLQYGKTRVEHYVKTKTPQAIKQDDVYYEILDKGTAPLVDTGKKVGIKFSSRDLQTGKVLSSNVDTSFHMPPVYEYVVAKGQMYKPVDDIIQKIGKGGKARIYMPAIIALGEKANNPATDLRQDVVFDIEVVSIK